VSEARCPVCQTAKAEVHHHPQASYRPHILIASVLLILLVAALAIHGSF